MLSEGMTRVLERFEQDPTFRERLRADPQGALQDLEGEGIVVTLDQLNSLRSKLDTFDWTLPPEELARRARETYA